MNLRIMTTQRFGVLILFIILAFSFLAIGGSVNAQQPSLTLSGTNTDLDPGDSFSSVDVYCEGQIVAGLSLDADPSNLFQVNSPSEDNDFISFQSNPATCDVHGGTHTFTVSDSSAEPTCAATTFEVTVDCSLSNGRTSSIDDEPDGNDEPMDDNGGDDSTDEEVVCTLEYDPVCGEDGVTYSNECMASVAEVGIAYEGECEDDSTDESQEDPEEEPTGDEEQTEDDGSSFLEEIMERNQGNDMGETDTGDEPFMLPSELPATGAAPMCFVG